MNDVQTNYSGHNQPARTKKAERTAPTAQRVYELDAETQRRRRSTERQTQVSSCANASDGFLKTSFLPKLEENKTVQDGQNPISMQRDFYTSLTKLAKHYSIVPMQTAHFDYPCNMALALWDIEEKLKKSVLNWQELRLLQDSKRTYFVSEEKYNTGTTLYYIPIEPLYLMTRDPLRRKTAQLLLSVCSYLYHIADIPYFRQENSYLYWMYEMHREWAEQDEEREENERYVREFDKAELIGDFMEQKIFSSMNLKVFERRLNAFKCRDAFDEKCLHTARQAFHLYAQYPNENIFRNAPLNNEDEDEREEIESIGMEKYISFIGSTKGWLYESLADSINNEFNEYGAMDEPTIVKSFDGNELADNSLDVEVRLFDLLDDLCELLYNYNQP
ncbi:hypothetical protein [Flavobacterium notoginsengisoli]|uniref:hypothetical protein n=1 Tax=Flavobacterium notoginsengisoli TaxID=1478199 RepID=UPI003638B606